MSEFPPGDQTDVSDEALKLVLIDQSYDAQNEARDRADARLDAELGEGGRLKKFVNGIWKGNIAKDYYRQKYVNEALDTIQSNENVFIDAPAERRTKAIESTIERFKSDYDELIHTDAGEKREIQADDSRLTRGIKDLIHKFVEGDLNAATLHEERTRLLNEYQKQQGPDAFNKGIVTTDNLLEIAQSVAGAVEHGESLDNALGKLQVITGEARNGARTEARFNTVDKAVDWLSKRGIGSFVTPGALAVGAAAALSIARVGSQSVVGAATKTLLPGVAAGAWAGIRENKRTKDDRAQHAREMATGGVFEESDKRRKEMEQARYDTISATTLAERLSERTDQTIYDTHGADAVQATLDALACIQARVQLSDSKKIDLISYSAKEHVGEERMMLDLARREVRLALESNLTSDIRTQLSIDQDKDLSELLQEKSDLFSEVLLGEEITDKDKAFAKLKRRRVAKAAAIGVATGIAGGLIVQEGVAAIDPERFGLIDMIRGDEAVVSGDGMVHQTILEGAIRGEGTMVHVDASTEYESYTSGSNGTIEVTNDHSLQTNPDGSLSLVDTEGKASVDGLVTDENGTFDEASLDKLEAAGMVVEDKSYNEAIVSSVTEQVSTDQYLQNHLAESTSVTRDLWYGNDTSAYDQNELRVYRGGSDDAPGIIEGGYQYTVAGMTAGGSYQSGESVDWNQAAASGDLFVAVSGTYDSQGNPFMIPIGPDGTVNIPADSPAGQFFSNENNSVSFNGAYMEVVQSTGQDAEGVVHIRPLATVVGDASVETINDTVTTETIVHHAEYSITTNGYDVLQENFTEMAPITPIASRRSMEALGAAGRAVEVPPSEVPLASENSEASSGYGYESQTNVEKLRRWESERSERLRNNPDAELKTSEELDSYYEQQRLKRGEGYLAEIESRIDQTEALKSMDGNSRAIVVMPVGAAQESENIYNALSVYAKQDSDAQEKTTILLNVNWIDDMMDDPEKKAAIEKTVSEIQRAKQDFPGLNIADFTKVWPREWVRDVRNNSIYGEVIKTLYDTAAFATRRAIHEGRIDQDQDIIMITNDADQLGMNRHYLQHYIEAEEKFKDSDAFIGTIRWGVDTAQDFPGYHVSQLFMQAMNIATSRPTTRRSLVGNPQGHTLAPVTIGPNSAFRLSTYAAIGGCEDRNDMGVGADSELGRKVLAARGRLPVRGADTYGTSGPRYFSGPSTSIGSRDRVIRQVIGSDVDSAPGRLLDSGYRSDKFIPHSWNYFDAGATRENDKNNPDLIEKEDPKNNFKPIQGRVERQITEFINDWYPDVSVASFTLSMLFPDVPELGSKAQAWTLKKSNDGRYSFSFTVDGARRFRNSLLRNSKGRYDPLGNRIRRRTYGEVKPKSRIQPVPAEAPLVRATA